LLRARPLRAPCTIRGERLLVDEIGDGALRRWVIGLSLDEPIWSPTTFISQESLRPPPVLSSCFSTPSRAAAGF